MTRGFVDQLFNMYFFVETPAGRVFVHAKECLGFRPTDLRALDTVGIERIEQDSKGARGYEVCFLERPAEEYVEGSVITTNLERGFVFVVPDDGGDRVLCHVRRFRDYENLCSPSFVRLMTGSRLRFRRFQTHMGTSGADVEVIDSQSRRGAA